jgi:DNA-binding XRE family transcriptional regulator
MPRKSIPSTSLVQAVRRYFGLQQRELATFLGVSEAMIGHIEAGRKVLPGKLLLRLNALAIHLPPDADTAGAPAEGLPATAPSPETKELEWRRALCTQRAGRLRRELAALLHRATYAARWTAALASQPDSLSPPTPLPSEALRPRAATLTPADVARYHLLRLQAEALETEAAALAALLE